ncbi:MAG: hypothetical protein BECKG1743F_GA0114225_106884, partial [Candidatus Kentron sp. G]
HDTRCGQSDKPRKRKVELQFALPQVENAPAITETDKEG